MRNYKKVVAITLCVSLLMGTMVLAGETDQKEISNPYIQELNEEVQIDGTNYKYEYDMENGKRVTFITNEDTAKTDKLLYDETNGIFYLNGEKIAEIIEESRNDEVQKNSFLKAAPAYTYLGAKSKKISWGKATTAAVLASMIATVLGYIGGAAIIGAVGATSLGVIASAASNGVVNAKTYSRKTGKITNYKYIWSFTPSGSRKYGDYKSYLTV